MSSGFIFGLTSGIKSEIIIQFDGLIYRVDARSGYEYGYSDLETETINIRVEPNDGIRRSSRQALIVGLVFGLSGVGMMAVGLSFGLGKMGGLGVGLGIGLVSTLIIFTFYYGFDTVIEHYTLRLLLWLSSAAPLNIIRVLDEARDRGLLVRVGGGYRFYHRLLQEYFAEHREPGERFVPVMGNNESGLCDSIGCHCDMYVADETIVTFWM